MGLFSFALKIGIVAYAIDWLHHKSRDFRSHEFQRSIENKLSEAADSAVTTVNETSPRVRQWLHEAWSCPSYQRHCSRFSKYNYPPESTTADLPNGRTSLEIDIPGIKKENILLSVNEHENVVILKATSNKNVEEGRRERSVETRLSLPRNSDASDLKATVQDGVLRIELGKKEFEGRRVVID